MAVALLGIGAAIWLKKNAKWIIFLVVVIIALIVIGKIINRPRRPRDKELLPGDIGGDPPTNWYPDDITDALYDVIDGFDSVYKKELEAVKFNTLMDNQMILVYNDWNHRFSTKKTWYGSAFGSLSQALRDESKGPQMMIMSANLSRLKLP